MLSCRQAVIRKHTRNVRKGRSADIWVELYFPCFLQEKSTVFRPANVGKHLWKTRRPLLCVLNEEAFAASPSSLVYTCRSTWIYGSVFFLWHTGTCILQYPAVVDFSDNPGQQSVALGNIFSPFHAVGLTLCHNLAIKFQNAKRVGKTQSRRNKFDFAVLNQNSLVLFSWHLWHFFVDLRCKITFPINWTHCAVICHAAAISAWLSVPLRVKSQKVSFGHLTHQNRKKRKRTERGSKHKNLKMLNKKTKMFLQWRLMPKCSLEGESTPTCGSLKQIASAHMQVREFTAACHRFLQWPAYSLLQATFHSKKL